jgi:uncharacterized protein
VRLDIAKETEVDAGQEACWQLISDVSRLSRCVPGVSNLQQVGEAQYTALLTDKLGPFRLELPVRITLIDLQEPRRLAADVRGHDTRGQARVQGLLEVQLEAAGDRTQLDLRLHMEVLGRLAALGATPMRRRTDEIFGEFVRRLASELA